MLHFQALNRSLGLELSQRCQSWTSYYIELKQHYLNGQKSSRQ